MNFGLAMKLWNSRATAQGLAAQSELLPTEVSPN